MEKVFLIVPTLIGHGEERMATLAAEVLQKKYDVTLIVFTKQNQQYFPDCRIVDLDIPAVGGKLGKMKNVLLRAIRVRKLRSVEKPKACISFGTSASFSNVFSKGYGKTIISYRGFASVQKGLSFYVSCFLADKIFCISKDLASQLISLVPWAEKKTSVIYNRIDIEAIERLKEEVCDHSPQRPAFVTVGRLEPVKGQDHLLKAFSRVKKTIPNASLTFVGDGSLRNELALLADKLEVSDSVFFVGAKKNPFNYLTKCDICVQSSISEGFLNVLVEAFACGVPVISTDCRSGPREILSVQDNIAVDGVTLADYGILVPAFTGYGSEEPKKEEILAEAMIRMATDKQLCQSYKNVVQERAAYFSKESYFTDLDYIIGGRKSEER